MKKYTVLMLTLWLTGITFSGIVFSASDNQTQLQQALQGKHRTPAYAARDGARHPAETLAFFGVQPDSTVVEIWPGGGGWYTEILAPYLKQKGTLYAAGYDENLKIPYYQKNRKKYEAKLAANPEVYSKVKISTFNPMQMIQIAPQNSADFVLTFRNVHNWKNAGEMAVANAFKTFYKALKPGGVLGLVEHRMPETVADKKDDKSGYIKQSYVIAMAKQAGFVLDSQSEINANPKDTADHPKGVWTLPPSFRNKEIDRAKYEAIGESDRMTLLFKKRP